MKITCDEDSWTHFFLNFRFFSNLNSCSQANLEINFKNTGRIFDFISKCEKPSNIFHFSEMKKNENLV